METCKITWKPGETRGFALIVSDTLEAEFKSRQKLWRLVETVDDAWEPGVLLEPHSKVGVKKKRVKLGKPWRIFEARNEARGNALKDADSCCCWWERLQNALKRGGNRES